MTTICMSTLPSSSPVLQDRIHPIFSPLEQLLQHRDLAIPENTAILDVPHPSHTKMEKPKGFLSFPPHPPTARMFQAMIPILLHPSHQQKSDRNSLRSNLPPSPKPLWSELAVFTVTTVRKYSRGRVEARHLGWRFAYKVSNFNSAALAQGRKEDTGREGREGREGGREGGKGGG